MPFEEFAALADTWAQIREMEEIAARERRRPRFIDDLGEPDDRPKPKDPKKQGVVSIYYEVKEPGHINVAIDCPERMPEDARQAVVRKVWAKWHAEADEPREGQAPPLQTRPEPVSDAAAGSGEPEPVSDSDHPMTEGDGELDPVPAEKPRRSAKEIGADAFATRKRNILASLARARAAGVSLGDISTGAAGLTLNDVMDILDRKSKPVVTWAALEKALKKLGYPPAAEAGEKEAEAEK